MNDNESSYRPNNRLSKILYLTNIIDVISQKHDIRKEPKTYLRGSKRKDALF